MTRVHDHQRRALYAPMLASRLDGYNSGTRIPALMDESGSDDALVQARSANCKPG